MSVSIIWSTSAGGTGISDIVDHGSAENGGQTTDQEIFIRHDGDNPITNVGFYIRKYSGNYSGSFTPTSDLNEIISWGTENLEADFGGFMVNFNAEGGYPAEDWPVYNNKTPTNGFVHRDGVGDSEVNAVEIPTVTGAAVAGEIQADADTGNGVRFKVRVEVPSNENEIGIRQWETVLRYSFTS